MKLLLTSAGLSNPTIAKALEELLGKSAKGVNLAFIPTAANIEPGEKSWLIEDLNNFQKYGYLVDIVDISAIDKDIWLPRLQVADVLFFGGGNTAYLMYWLKKSGLETELPSLLKSKIYAGISAGSCVAGPTIENPVQNLFGETNENAIETGLNLVNLQVVPHLDSPNFEKIRESFIEDASKQVTEPVYALDDNSALKIIDGLVEVISEGKYLEFNKNL